MNTKEVATHKIPPHALINAHHHTALEMQMPSVRRLRHTVEEYRRVREVGWRIVEDADEFGERCFNCLAVDDLEVDGEEANGFAKGGPVEEGEVAGAFGVQGRLHLLNE